MTDYHHVSAVRTEVSERLTTEARHRAAAGLAPLGPDEEQELARRFTDEALAAEAARRLSAGRAPVPVAERTEVAEAVLAAMYQMGRLQRFLDAPDLDNVIIHGAASATLEWADGRIEHVASPFESDEDLIAEVQALATRRGRTERRFDWANPRLDMRLPDGSRLTAVMSVAHRPTIVIRRHRFVDLGLDDLVRLGTIDRALHAFLAAAVTSRRNLLVAGTTNVGKTSMVRALVALADPDEHLVTIETSLELGLHHLARHRNVTALEAREANAEGHGAIPVRALTEYAARLNPDRILVGEVLGDEALTMLRALGAGADGSLSTVHARHSDAVARRLASYVAQSPTPLPVAATLDLIADAVDLIVFLAFVRDGDGRRRRVVSSVREVTGTSDGRLDTNEVFAPGFDGRAVPTGVRPRCADELAWAGLDLGLLDNALGWWAS